MLVPIALDRAPIEACLVLEKTERHPIKHRDDPCSPRIVSLSILGHHVLYAMPQPHLGVLDLV
jgi:hypothetical protein